MPKLTIFTDGACKGNPGDAGIGVVIADQRGTVMREVGEYIGRTTNNVAEYTALIRGLSEALDLRADEVEVSVDSELMARQLAGVYKVKSPNLQPLHAEATALLGRFGRVSITHVLREFNARADQLANEGIKKHRKKVARAAKPTSPKPRARPEPVQKELEF